MQKKLFFLTLLSVSLFNSFTLQGADAASEEPIHIDTSHPNYTFGKSNEKDAIKNLMVQKLLLEMGALQNNMTNKNFERDLAERMYADKQKAESNSRSISYNFLSGLLQLVGASPTLAAQLIAPGAAKGFHYLFTSAEVLELEKLKQRKEQLLETSLQSAKDLQLMEFNLKDSDNEFLQKTFEEAKKERNKLSESHAKTTLHVLQKENHLFEQSQRESSLKWKEQYWKPVAVVGAATSVYLGYKLYKK